MKGILIEPGKSPEVTSLPDTLQGIEARLQCPCEQKVLPPYAGSAGVRHLRQRLVPYLSRPASLWAHPVLRLAEQHPAAPEQRSAV